MFHFKYVWPFSQCRDDKNGDTETKTHGCIKRTGYIVGGGPPFIPMKVAQWRMKPKKGLSTVK